MNKTTIDLKSIIIFLCVLFKYLIEYKINTYVLYAIVLIILYFILIRSLLNLTDRKKILLISIFLCVTILNVIIYKDVNLLITLILAMTLINSNFYDFLRKFMISSSVMFIITICLYYLGFLNDNYLIRMTTSGYAIRHSLGFTHPNSVFMYFLPIVLCNYILIEDKKKFYIVFLTLSFILYYISLSRTGIYCVILLFILDKMKNKINMKTIIRYLPIILFFASYLIAIKFGNARNNHINILLSDRPYLWNQIISNLKIFTPFGTNALTEVNLDNFYLSIVYRNGLFNTLIYYFILFFGMKNIRNKKVCVSIIVFMFYGIAESNTIIGSINFTLAILLYSILNREFKYNEG